MKYILESEFTELFGLDLKFPVCPKKNDYAQIYFFTEFRHKEQVKIIFSTFY